MKSASKQLTALVKQICDPSKDLKQILRKEQVDASILLTANVPAAKKIIVHGPQGPDEGGIPSQFPIGEEVQFCQILQEALDFFGIEDELSKEHFLVDHKTSQLSKSIFYHFQILTFML